MRLILATLALFLSATAAGQSATAQFAPGQLRLARSELQQAEQALSRREYDLARQLAAQAGLDARIAYGMSDSQFLRRDAVQLHEHSAHLRWLVLQANAALAR
jgi:hypothetical protein